MTYSRYSPLSALAVAGLTLLACQREPVSVFQGAEDLCGPCGSLATGNFSISGNAQLDGFFRAIATLSANVQTITAGFDGELLALAEVFGVNTVDVEVDAAFAAMLTGAIQADLAVYLDGGLSIAYTPPMCSANVAVTVEAQAACEASAECDVDVMSGQAELACSGSCTGTCSGTCSGDLSCAVQAPGVTCEGMCEGSCTFAGAAACDGTCRGSCEGTCSLTDAEGNCAGVCEGMCDGVCELTAAAQCTGTCTGTCLVEQGSASCSAEAECRGTCEGGCTGTCEGSFEPPSAAADCQASADCQAQARAQGEASLECTPPTIEFVYTLKAGLTAAQKAEFSYKLSALKLHSVVALQAGARLTALFTGEVDGEVVFDPPPFVGLSEELEIIVDTGITGELDIPAGRLPCVIPAFSEGAAVLADVGGTIGGSVGAYVEFVTLFTGG